MSSTAVSLIDQDHYAQFGPPHEEFRRLRAEAPVSWHEASDGRKFWAVTKYRDLFKVSLDPKTFSSAHRGAIFRNWSEDEYEPQKRLLINLDPPDHTRFRRLVSLGFSSRMIRRLEQHVRNIGNELIDNVAGARRVRLRRRHAAELPLQVIVEMIGVPREDRHQFFDWSNG